MHPPLLEIHPLILEVHPPDTRDAPPTKSNLARSDRGSTDTVTIIDYQNYSTSHLKVIVIAVSTLPRTFTFTIKSLTFTALSKPHLPYQTHQLYQLQHLKKLYLTVESYKIYAVAASRRLKTLKMTDS